MSDRDVAQMIDVFSKMREEFASAPEKSDAFLKDAGILNHAGELAEPYTQGA
jgi:hypothetical protein